MVPEEEFIDQLQMRPSSLQGWFVLLRVKLGPLDITKDEKCAPAKFKKELTEGLLVGGRALKRFTENM